MDVLGDYAVNIILSTLYFRHVDDIDLYTGGLSEIRTKGGLTGPTFACIIGKSFASWKFGDRFWYENNFKKTGFTPRKLFCLIFC
jgi:peroxidase